MDLTKATENPTGVYRQGYKIVKVTQEAINAFVETNPDNIKEVARTFWGTATEIGEGAFEGLDFTAVTYASKERNDNGDKLVNRDITSSYSKPTPAFYIPSDITTIGDNAFRGCVGLESIQIGYRSFSEDKTTKAGATVIGDNAFSDIKGLKAVFFGQDVKDIKFGKDVFSGNNFKYQVDHITRGVRYSSPNDVTAFSSLSEEEIRDLMSAEFGLEDINISNIPENIVSNETKKSIVLDQNIVAVDTPEDNNIM